MSISAIKEVTESLKLPLGHIKRKKAQRRLDKIYSKCQEISSDWWRRFKKKRPYHYSPRNALNFCNKICDLLGERHLKRVVIHSIDIQIGSGGHYSKREIHFPGKVWFPILIHELAHHFGEHGHGKDYCDMLQIIWQVAYTEITGNQPKKNWRVI